MFLTYFSTLGGLAALNVAVTEFINKMFKISKKWVKQLISWTLPVLLSCVGLLLGLGLFADYGTFTDWQAWVYTVLTGVGVGLVSNGIYDIDVVRQILSLITGHDIKKNTETNKDV